MKKVVFLILISLLTGCKSLITSHSNPCDSDFSRNELKKRVGVYMWAKENAKNLGLGVMLALSSEEGVTRLQERAKEYIQSINIEEIGKPTKLGENFHQCSAVLELRGKRYTAVYIVEKIHSGRENYYKVTLIEVLEVR